MHICYLFSLSLPRCKVFFFGGAMSLLSTMADPHTAAHKRACSNSHKYALNYTIEQSATATSF